MTVSINQQVDLLYKQAFGVTKTDDPTNKSPSNESIPSPLLIRGDTIWNQSGSIPGTAGAVSGIVQVTGAIECTADNTTVPIGGVYPTWKTGLTNWIPTQFGASYNVNVYIDNPGAGNPASTGTQIFAAGSGSTGEYYFNYVSGVLNFIGDTIPAALTSGKKIYVSGYRYIGSIGSSSLPSNVSIGNINLTGSNITTSTTNSNLNVSGNGTGAVVVGGTGNIYANNFIASAGVYTNNLYYANGTVWDMLTASGAANYIQFSNGTDLTSSANFQFDNGNSNLNVIGNVNIGPSSNIQLLANGTIVANNFSGNFSGNISANLSNIGGNLGVLFNNANAVTSNTTFTYNPTTNALSVGNTVTSNYFIGKFDSTSSSQPNITSLGNLTSLTVGSSTPNVSIDGSGNITAGGNISANNITSNGSLNAVDATFTGNLTVSGMTTFVNTTTTTIKDPLLTLGGNTAGGNATSYDGYDRGLVLDNYTNGVGGQALNQALIWKTANSEFEFGSNVSVATNVVTINQYANVKAQTFKGNVVATDVSATTLDGNLTTSAQPNITSVGTLTSANVSGLANVLSLQVGGLSYPNTDGSAGQYLSTYGNGTLYFNTVDTALISNGSSNIQVYQDGVITISTDGNSNIATFGTDGSLTIGSGSGGNIDGVNYLNANIANVLSVTIGNSTITSITATTSATSQAILASISASSITGIEFIIKGETTGKYSATTVLAVTDGSSNVDYTIFGTVNLGGSTGSISMSYASGNVQLLVTPVTSATTTWTTQYRLI